MLCILVVLGGLLLSPVSTTTTTPTTTTTTPTTTTATPTTTTATPTTTTTTPTTTTATPTTTTTTPTTTTATPTTTTTLPTTTTTTPTTTTTTPTTTTTTPTTTSVVPVTTTTVPSPVALKSINITNIQETSFSVNWTPADHRNVTQVYVDITSDSNNTNYTVNDVSQTSLPVTGLLSGIRYTVYAYRVNADMRSEAQTKAVYTVPSPPSHLSIPMETITSDSLTVTWTDRDPRFHLWDVVTLQQNTASVHNISVNNTSQTVPGLSSGTNYTLEVYTTVPDQRSQAGSISSYTRPTAPVNASISMQYETKFTLSWAPNNDRFDKYRILVSPKPSEDNFTVASTVTNRTISGLTAATNYSVSVYTEAGGLLSLTPLIVTSYTSPLKPESVTVTDIDKHSVQINFSQDENVNLDHYSIIYQQNGQQNTTVISTMETVTIVNLTAGRQYNFTIYSLLYGILSEHQTVVTTYTKSLNVRNITLNKVTISTMQVSWTLPDEGGADRYMVLFHCISPNDVQPSIMTDHDPPEVKAMARDLDPGTFCSVTVTAIAGNVIGDPEVKLIETSTDEMAPAQVTGLTATVHNSADVTVFWNRPAVRNGLIRQYDLLVMSPNGDCAVKIVLACNYCQNMSHNNCQDSGMHSDGTDTCSKNLNAILYPYRQKLQKSINGLLPYTNYTFQVSAFTKCYGLSTDFTAQTDQNKPATSPHNVTVLSTSYNYITIQWAAPLIPNGVITNYSINYSYRERVCHGSGDLQTEVIYPEMTLLGLAPPTLTIPDLHPYWNYTITIQAATSEGYGPASTPVTYMTATYHPGNITNVTSINPPASYYVTLHWTEPCFPNGVVTNYSILVMNRDTGQNRTINTHDARLEWTIPTLPYSNYNMKVAGCTSEGCGSYSHGHDLTTDTAVPLQPTEVTARAGNSTAITVTWRQPSMYTGPTNYMATAVDTANSSKRMHCDTGIDLYATSCMIHGMEAFWNYTITVTATTDKGSNVSAEVFGQTLPAPPGSVSGLTVTPEADIKAPRSITVNWKPPSADKLNGIITGYAIVYAMKREDDNAVHKPVEESSRQYIIRDIPPGLYVIKVYASTAAGNGSETSRETTLASGALMKPDESGGLLVQASAGAVQDGETEISIELPLSQFLCNTSNGRPVRWGVIVAEAHQATDLPYYGSAGSYDEKTAYPSWFVVRSLNPVPPYRATPDGWKPCSSTGGGRKRRATTDTVQFIVGNSGDCTGVPNTAYCNGKLPSGCSFRVKSFVCTEGGCTETEYSGIISTTSPTTAALAAGLGAAACVLVVVGVVVAAMKWRRTACFSKDAESTCFSHSRTPPMGTELKEQPKTQTFRSQPVKLNDFPAYVERFQKDSGLLFADAYRSLREMSPRHSIATAESQSCRPKNRYTNIMPFDHSRVKLQPMADVEGSDYINANYIPGYTSRREYIATQGPIDGTVDDFWRMLWEQNVDIIVMLTKCVEQGKHKCVQYWPNKRNGAVFHGDLIVTVLSESFFSDYEIRVIEIKLQNEKQKRTLHQFCFLKWPDMGCSEESNQLMDFVTAVRQHVTLRQGPMVVHCSSGIGRTGTFICVDRLLQHIRDHDEVEIFDMVLEIHDYRCNMVQTEEQYVYIHRCLRDYIAMNNDGEDDEEHTYEDASFSDDIYEATD